MYSSTRILTIALYFFLFCPVNISAEGVTNPRLLGTDCSPNKPTDFTDAKEIKIEYAGRDNATYSKSSPRPVQLIVFHDPGDNNCNNIEQLVAYGQKANGRPECGGGSCGYHFYVGTNGRIIQGAPMNVRTNHKSGQNSYSLGISLICAGPKTNLPQAQVENSVALSEALRVAYGFNAMIPHNKAPNEGIYITNVARSKTVNNSQKFLINYSLANGQNMYCKIQGKIPDCNTVQCSNDPIEGKSFSGYSPYNNFSSPYTDGQGNYIGDSASWSYPLMNQQPPQQPQIRPNPLPNLIRPISNPQPTPPPIVNTQQPNTTTLSDLNQDPECTSIKIINNKAKMNYYLGLYNKNYLQKFGEWSLFLQKEPQTNITFSFDNFFANFFAKQIRSYAEAIDKCGK